MSRSRLRTFLVYLDVMMKDKKRVEIIIAKIIYEVILFLVKLETF